MDLGVDCRICTC